MKKLLSMVLGVGVACLLAQPAQAGWMSCGKTVCCAPHCAVCYVDKVVTTYQPVYKESTVAVTVNKLVAQEMSQEYTYYECVPVTTVQKGKVVEYKTVAKQVPYTYYECVPVTTVQKAKVVEYTTV